MVTGKETSSTVTRSKTPHTSLLLFLHLLLLYLHLHLLLLLCPPIVLSFTPAAAFTRLRISLYFHPSLYASLSPPPVDFSWHLSIHLCMPLYLLLQLTCPDIYLSISICMSFSLSLQPHQVFIICQSIESWLGWNKSLHPMVSLHQQKTCVLTLTPNSNKSKSIDD